MFKKICRRLSTNLWLIVCACFIRDGFGSHFEEEECFVVGQMLCFWRFCLCVSLPWPNSCSQKVAPNIVPWKHRKWLLERERERERENWGDVIWRHCLICTRKKFGCFSSFMGFIALLPHHQQMERNNKGF